MPPSSSIPPESDPLQPVLDDAEAELRRRLHEACVAEEKGVSTESTQEIRRLEDTLLAAAVAARQTIKVRRQMKLRASGESERPVTSNETAKRKEKVDSPTEFPPYPKVRAFAPVDYKIAIGLIVLSKL